MKEWVRGFVSISTTRNPLTLTLSPNGERERTEFVARNYWSAQRFKCDILPASGAGSRPSLSLALIPFRQNPHYRGHEIWERRHG